MMIELVWLAVGAVLGAVVGYLVADRRGLARGALQESAAALAEQRALAAEQRAGDTQAQLISQQQVTESIRARLADAERQDALRTAQLAAAQERSTDLHAQLIVSQDVAANLRTVLADVQATCAAQQAQIEASQERLALQAQSLDEAQLKLKEAFASMSQEALARNNEAFLELARQRFETLTTQASGSLEQKKAEIDGQLKPMHELLNAYQGRLSEIEKSRTESYSMLREQLGSMMEAQRTLNTQTTQLVSALRRPSARGQWGEITLKRLVELAGMSAHCDYCEQATVEGVDGKQRPDMVISLPNERQIIIDCKATLDAFLDAAAAPDDDHRRLCMKRHAEQVRGRARELSSKAYWAQFKQSPEFVVMFLPGEAFLYAAVEQDGALIEDCLKNHIVIATPTTLISLLKAVEYGWRQEQVTEHAEQIRKHGKDLYDRIAIVLDYFAKLGKTLDSAVGAYNATLGSVQGRLIVTARKISELGARSEKELPEVDPIDTKARELGITEFIS